MKLKKIASLALAGIMAVSMLAGCGEAASSNPTNPETPATGIVAAVNNAQSAYNKVKVTFTSDSTLENALATAVRAKGENAREATVLGMVAQLTGLSYDANMNDVIKTDTIAHTSRGDLLDSNVDGKVVTDLNGFKVGNALSEEAAMKLAAEKINNDAVSQLVDTTYVDKGTISGDKYADYSYTGTVCMVSVENTNGTTSYYVAYTITKTTDVVTFEA